MIHVGKSAAEKRREMIERVRAKEESSKARVVARRLRGKQRPAAAVLPAAVCQSWHGMW